MNIHYAKAMLEHMRENDLCFCYSQSGEFWDVEKLLRFIKLIEG